MRKFVLPLILVASLGATSLAMAAGQNAQGIVKAVDAKAMTLTLGDGSIYKLPARFKVADLKTGEKVKLSWQKVGKVNDATSIAILK
jgi:Cu/Ag efflux protein CusF